MSIYTQQHEPSELYKLIDIFDRFSVQNIIINICWTTFQKSLSSVGVHVFGSE